MMISDLKHGLFKYDVKDYYAILGVPVSATPKEIRLRYLKIAYQLHPDTNRAETEADKKKASTILSKLVNPAYENLYKDNLRKECQLIFSEVARRLATDQYKITIGSETGKKLLQEEKNIDKIYLDTLEKLAPEQYLDLDKLAIKIGLISELNMVYLMRQKNPNFNKGASSQPQASQPQIVMSEGAISQSPTPNSSVNNNPPVSDNPPKVTVSRLDKLIESAKQHAENDNYEQGIIDLREAVKIDPNSSTAHALLGSLYLKQNNATYAKIHINKAMTLNGNDPIAIQAQKELKELGKKDKGGSTTAKTAKASGKPADKSKDKGKDKSKSKDGKKEAPKIFGIPLW
ncbi:J domain-containing protein [Geminocystis sp. CENA526]|uniref:J domain-containing protein n=1 Tax=Geminocystis sp. CENA526 TaxID=1355871 RepID=UPI003D700DDE